MRKFVYSALALSAAITPAVASEGDWLSLDQELEAFPTLLDNHEGPKVSGYIITTYRYTQDVDGVEDAETSDFRVEKARVAVSGDIGDTGYSYKVQGDFASGGMILRDGYVTFPIAGGIQGRFGNQKLPFLRSGLLSSSRLFFMDRTGNGGVWAGRQAGVQVMGSADALRWFVGAYDGKDGAGTDHQFAARIEFDAMGEGLQKVEGSQGGSDDVSLTIAAAFSSDGGAASVGGDTVVGGQAYGLEANAVTNVYSFGVEFVNYAENDNGTSHISGVEVGEDARSTFAVQGTFMLSPGNDDGSDAWEAGLRFEDFDDDAETTRVTAGVNHYIMPAHRLKWQFQFRSTMADDDGTEDENQFGVGLVASF